MAVIAVKAAAICSASGETREGAGARAHHRALKEVREGRDGRADAGEAEPASRGGEAPEVGDDPKLQGPPSGEDFFRGSELH